ncbi:MerR family DNA-binding transcriptional regulator [Fontibacillus panacisegetis]
MNKLSIGQMAKLNNISEQTLRYYDKVRLVFG